MTSRRVVLVVDDHDDVRLSLSEILEARGYPVDTASDGQEAVDLVRILPYCFVIMDVRMPKMDGIQALLEIKKLRPAVPVALVSVYQVSLPSGLLDLGAVALLTKPVNIEELMGLLGEYCG